MLQSECKPFSFCCLLLQTAIHPPTAGCIKLSPRQNGLSARTEQLFGGCGLEISMWILWGFFFFYIKKNFFFSSEMVTISCWSPQTWQSRHSNTKQVVQHLCVLTMCLCHLTPCSDLARTEEQEIGKAQLKRRKYQACFQFVRDFIRAPEQEGMDKFNPPVRSKKSFVKGSTVGDLEQQKGWGKVSPLRVPCSSFRWV